MKKLKIILNVVAFVVGITGAFASQMFLSSPGYLYEAPGGVPKCTDVIDCSNEGSTCKFNGIAVGNANDPMTSCGSPLLHRP